MFEEHVAKKEKEKKAAIEQLNTHFQWFISKAHGSTHHSLPTYEIHVIQNRNMAQSQVYIAEQVTPHSMKEKESMMMELSFEKWFEYCSKKILAFKKFSISCSNQEARRFFFAMIPSCTGWDSASEPPPPFPFSLSFGGASCAAMASSSLNDDNIALFVIFVVLLRF